MLYVEDDDATAYLFTVALSTSGMGPRFHRVKNGEQALQFLLLQGVYSDAPQPDLVLLDLHLPIKNGFDVLADMKNHPRLRDIPVVVFSTSTRAHDRERSLQLGAVDYVRKEDEFANFLNVANNISKRLTVQQREAGAKTQAAGYLEGRTVEICRLKLRLTAEYDTAIASFWEAATTLHQRIGRSGKVEYECLSSRADAARLKSEEARLALEHHRGHHGC